MTAKNKVRITWKQREKLLNLRTTMIENALEMTPDYCDPHTPERKAFRAGLSVGWREAVNILQSHGLLASEGGAA